MKIHEVSKLIDMTESNIRHYEKSGLIKPKREANNYRSYSEEDVKILKQIILMRMVGTPLKEIEDVFNSNVSLNDMLHTRIEELEEDQIELDKKKNICNMLIDKNASFDDTEEILQDQLYTDATSYAEILEKIRKQDTFKQRSYKILGSIGLGVMLLLCAYYAMTWYISYLNYATSPWLGIVVFIIAIGMILNIIYQVYKNEKGKE
ncbi:MerR family transcriptional regulator [uncultured Robinsoniella sp.]|uniref:MerR family transcriptional regulator n=1 Tax=uncultured Robinsoniella sp. TaxID=904190 RepID=UPI00374FC26A